ncbi:MAG: MlaD family protein [Acidimicrobiia bacterium]
MEYFRADVKVGRVIFIALALLAFAAISVGNLGSWFADRQRYTVLLQDAGLLPQGAQVSYAGYPVGQVTAIAVRSAQDRVRRHPAYPLALTIAIRSTVPLREDARVEMKTNGMIGDRYVDIVPGTGKPLPPGSTLLGSAGGLEGMLASLSGVPAGVDTLLGALQTLLTDASRPDTIPATLAAMNRLLHDLQRHSDTLTTTSTDLLQRVQREIVSTTGKARRTLETLDATITENRPGIQRFVNGLNTTLVEVRRTVDATGEFLEAGKGDIVVLLQSVHHLVEGIEERGEVLLTRAEKLLVDVDEMVVQNDRNIFVSIENVRDMTANLRAASELVRANPAVLLWGNRGKKSLNQANTSLQRTGVLQDRGHMARYDRVR